MNSVKSRPKLMSSLRKAAGILKLIVKSETPLNRERTVFNFFIGYFNFNTVSTVPPRF